MGINDRKVGDWSTPVVNEENRPNRTAAAMKAIFDANSNELKTALNGVIDDLRAGDADVAFTEAATRTNLASGDTHAALFGKLKKWLADLTPAVQTIKTDQGIYRFLRGDGTYQVPEVGEAYNGVPSGGTAGQVLAKESGTDFDSGWKTITPADIGAAAVRRFTAQVPATWTATPAVAAETTVTDGTVAVAQAAFLAAAENTPGAYVFTYDGTNLYWTLAGVETALADYGLTLTGTPADGNTITVTYTEVAPYAQQVAVEGVLESDKPTVDLVPSATFATAEAEIEVWGLIYDIQTADGSVTLYATEAPETAFSIQMEVVR